MIRFERVADTLPPGLEMLREAARAEGYRMLDTLSSEWASGENRFDRAGEALFAAYSEGALAGIGGLTVEPLMPGAYRMRRFYVSARFRRGGIARRLAGALLDAIAGAGGIVTVNAAAGSEAFWESLGFTTDRRDGRTHIRR